MKKIDSKIVDYRVAETGAEGQTEAKADKEKPPMAEVVHMHESVERPEFLMGSTYKIKTPLSEHALYVTINDIVLNEGTEHELRRPFEIFINSKNMDHFQWVLALTRVISAVFRKGGDSTFLVEEMKAVFDPKGGYFKKGGRFMPSLVADIGYAIESHMKMIGLLVDEELDENQKKFLAQKRAEFEETQSGNDKEFGDDQESGSDSSFPNSATLCGKCYTKALVLMDGCMTCLSCGDSKCG